jgi:radical SAM protein with 4Fe4S-binding SPASM domain
MKGWKYSEEWLENLKVISHLKLPCGVGAMTMDGSGLVAPELQSIVGRLAGWQGHTRADSLNLEQIKGQGISLTPRNEFSLTCRSTPFYDRNVLLPNGDVVLCCMDYDLKHIIGNLLKQTYEEIFQSKPLLDLIAMNEKPEFNKCSICKSCDNVRKI